MLQRALAVGGGGGDINPIEMIVGTGYVNRIFRPDGTTTAADNVTGTYISSTISGDNYIYKAIQACKVMLVKPSNSGIFTEEIKNYSANEQITSVAIGDVYFPIIMVIQ